MKENLKFFKRMEEKLGFDDFVRFSKHMISSYAITLVDGVLNYLYEMGETQESSVDEGIIQYLNDKRGYSIKSKNLEDLEYTKAIKAVERRNDIKFESEADFIKNHGKHDCCMKDVCCQCGEILNKKENIYRANPYFAECSHDYQLHKYCGNCYTEWWGNI